MPINTPKGSAGKPHLVFIDDDETEINEFRPKVKDHYQVFPVPWPDKDGKKLFRDLSPDLFVSDLYLPPSTDGRDPSDEEIDAAKKKAQEVVKLFQGLYEDPRLDHKKRLKKTMNAITEAYRQLQMQWTALGQSPDHGIALLQKLKALYPDVPFVFYSRKITPEDVINVLDAGADDAIRKDALNDPELLARLRSVQRHYQE